METECPEKSDESVLQNVNNQSQDDFMAMKSIAINRQCVDNANRGQNLQNFDKSSEENSEISSIHSNNIKDKALE